LVEKNLAKIVQVVVLRAKYVILASTFGWSEPEFPQGVEKVLKVTTTVTYLQGRFGPIGRVSFHELDLPYVTPAIRRSRDAKIHRLTGKVTIKVK